MNRPEDYEDDLPAGIFISLYRHQLLCVTKWKKDEMHNEQNNFVTCNLFLFYNQNDALCDGFSNGIFSYPGYNVT